MLVQAAADKSEQNLEAYLKNSQLYYRPTRKIHSNEELLVWYDDELSWLLGFHEIKASKKLQSGEFRKPVDFVLLACSDVPENWLAFWK